jgi:hypothetical protein
VINNDANAQDKVTLLSDCSVISALPNIFQSNTLLEFRLQ